MTRIWKLPMPPSTNSLYRNISAKERAMANARGYKIPGRVKTDRYRDWGEQAGLALMTQGPRKLTTGHFAMIITLLAPSQGDHIDADNIKAVADLLATHNLIEDDSLMAGLSVWWHPGPTKEMHVAIVPTANPWNPENDNATQM